MAIQPDVYSGADSCSPTIKGIGYHQKVVRSNGKKLPIKCSSCLKSLVHLKELGRESKDQATGQVESWIILNPSLTEKFSRQEKVEKYGIEMTVNRKTEGFMTKILEI